MKYDIKQTLIFNNGSYNESYSEGDFVEVTYQQPDGTEKKIKGRIYELSVFVPSNPYMQIDISERYKCNKEIVYLNDLISIKNIKESE